MGGHAEAVNFVFPGSSSERTPYPTRFTVRPVVIESFGLSVREPEIV